MTTTLTEQVVAGGDDDFCTVRHAVLAGSYEDIGAALAEMAERHHAFLPVRSTDRIGNRARRRWFEVFYPELAARARGIARHFGVSAGDERFDLASVPVGFPAAGCSVAWVPPERSASGAGLVSRNFDFTRQTFTELFSGQANPGEPALAAEPYILQTRPDRGHATLLISSFDLASGATDGINDAGLVAALLADEESGGAEPTYAPQAGLAEHEICRYLLETCATAEEAIEALRMAKQYYYFVPCHYFVCDRRGKAFVWEHTAAHNGEHIVSADGPMVVTNHLLQRYPTIAGLPVRPGNGWTFDRARRLTAALADPRPIDVQTLERRHACVRILDPDTPVRTLWHAVYDTEALTMDISFHLGDTPGGERRSPYLSLALQN